MIKTGKKRQGGAVGNIAKLLPRQHDGEYHVSTMRDADLFTLYAGWDRCISGHTHTSVRDHFLVHCVCTGKGSVISNGKTYHLTAGSIFFFSPYQRIYHKADRKNPWTILWTGFGGKDAGSVLARCGITSDNNVFKGNLSKKIVSTLVNIGSAIQSQQDQHDIAANGYLRIFLSEFAEEYCVISPDRNEKSKREAVLDLAVQFIETKYREEISVEEVARHTGYNRSYLSDLFHKNFGKSLRDYLIHHRIRKACEFFERSGLPVAEVQAAVGYNDYFAFVKRFKKIIGVSPYQYRKGKRDGLT